MAGYIADAVIERIREATDIVGLVAEYVQLKRTGSTYKALCPFHSEKTPSFNVVPSKQIFKCFGCGAAGDAFSFIMRLEGVEFGEAVRLLAGRAGIEIGESSFERGKRTSRDRLYRANAWAAKRFRELLQSSAAAARARAYLVERGIGEGSQEAFRLGYSAPDWDDLVRLAGEQKADMSILVQAGLVRQRTGGGYRDQFHDRLMFPIVDAGGRVVGFGARSLDGSEPKYLNSPETPIFSKGRTLYGLDRAAAAMRRGGRAVVVEGYTDVIMAHQHGVADAVAVLGTAVTPDHVRTLRRFAQRAVLVLDQDPAGRASAERSVDSFVAEGMEATVGSLPEGKDPCEFLLARGGEAFEEVLRAARSPIAFRLERLRAEGGARWETAGALDPVLHMVGLIGDPVAQEIALKEVARETGVAEPTLRMRLGQLGRRRSAAPPQRMAPVSRDPARELVCAMLSGAPAAKEVRAGLDMDWIEDPVVRSLIARALEIFAARGEVDAAALLARTQDPQERATLEAILGAEAPAEDPVRWARGLLRRLRALHLERAAAVLEQRLHAASADEEKASLVSQLAALRRQEARPIGFARRLLAPSRRPAG